MAENINIDDVISDRYRILSLIGEGGMSKVFLAEDVVLGRKVALKVLLSKYLEDESAIERFKREAKAAAALAHRNIVAIHDFGESDGMYYIVMEYIDGKTLEDVIKRGPLPAKFAVKVSYEIARGLSYAHKNGVIHRDIKPGNIIFTTDGIPKLADFGVAKFDDQPDNLVKDGMVVGTVTYFAPEQAQGFAGDQRSDLYSLGVVIYQMITGKLPFIGQNANDLAYKHLQEPPPSISGNLDISRKLAEALPKLLAKDPKNRFQNVDEFLKNITPDKKNNNEEKSKLDEIDLNSTISSYINTSGIKPLIVVSDTEEEHKLDSSNNEIELVGVTNSASTQSSDLVENSSKKFQLPIKSKKSLDVAEPKSEQNVKSSSDKKVDKSKASISSSGPVVTVDDSTTKNGLVQNNLDEKREQLDAEIFAGSANPEVKRSRLADPVVNSLIVILIFSIIASGAWFFMVRNTGAEDDSTTTTQNGQTTETSVIADAKMDTNTDPSVILNDSKDIAIRNDDEYPKEGKLTWKVKENLNSVSDTCIANPDTETPFSVVMVSVMEQVGELYDKDVSHERTNDNPSGFKSAELVRWAYSRAGVYLKDDISGQVNELSECNYAISIDEALKKPGSLLYHTDDDKSKEYVAISLGTDNLLVTVFQNEGVKINEYDSKAMNFQDAFYLDELGKGSIEKKSVN